MLKGLDKAMIRASVSALLLVALCVSAFATGETDTPTAASTITQITAGITASIGDILTAIGTIAVAALAIFGVMMAIRLGLRAFRSVSGR